MPGEILPAFGFKAIGDPTAEVRQCRFLGVGDGGGGKAGLAEACQGFEALFINMLLQEMRKTVPDDGLLPTSNAMRTWQQLFDNQLADALASKQEMGLAKMLYQQLQDQVGEKS
jgi:Rod binding domain-containing protein